jgi:hypothetical protein
VLQLRAVQDGYKVTFCPAVSSYLQLINVQEEDTELIQEVLKITKSPTFLALFNNTV